MKKKIIACCSACILIIGACLFLTMGGGAGASRDAGTNTGTEANIETSVVESTGTDVEASTGTEAGASSGASGTRTDAPGSEEEEQVFFWEEEAVRNHPLFHAFVNREVANHDDACGEDRYVQEYYAEYRNVYGVQCMAEDLDGDGEAELLALIQSNNLEGDLYVFHEAGGKLYAWEVWRDFSIMQMPSIKYHGNGIFSQGGGGGCIFGRYNAEGRIEYVVEFYSWAGEYSEYGDMTLYEDGVAVKRYAYDIRDKEPSQVTAEELAARDACAAILDEAYERAGEGEYLGGIEWREDVKRIPLEELLSMPAGQPSAPQGQQTEKGPQEKRTVQVVEEEGGRETPAFAAFLDKETTAHDKKEGKDWYIYEYFTNRRGTMCEVHYMAEDLNQDKKDELLIFVKFSYSGTGDLLVFEETEDGSLAAWEECSFITGDRKPDLYYCSNGFLMVDGVVGTEVARYTQEGTPEVLMGYYTKLEDTNDDYYVLSIELWLCEDGKTGKSTRTR